MDTNSKAAKVFPQKRQSRCAAGESQAPAKRSRAQVTFYCFLLPAQEEELVSKYNTWISILIDGVGLCKLLLPFTCPFQDTFDFSHIPDQS